MNDFFLLDIAWMEILLNTTVNISRNVLLLMQKSFAAKLAFVSSYSDDLYLRNELLQNI